jgi:hypothetical protein
MKSCNEKPTGAAACQHSHTRTEILPPGSSNYSALICANCGRTLTFLPKPANQEKWATNAKWIAFLQKHLPELDSWERRFVDSLAEAGQPGKRLTTAQQQAFDSIVLDFMEPPVDQFHGKESK